MRKPLRLIPLAMFAALLLMLSGVAQAQLAPINCPSPKCENFILFVDHSGSMAMEHKTFLKDKIVLAKDALIRMNQLIPNLPYNGALITAAPYKDYVKLDKYDRAKMDKALKGLQEEFDVFNRLTPLGDSLLKLDPVLAKTQGCVNVILVSDGMRNIGSDAVEAAQSLYAKYPNKLYIHIISYADEKEGKAVLDKIAAMNKGAVYVDAAQVRDANGLRDFVEKVFCGAANPPKCDIEGPETVRLGDRVVFSAARSKDPNNLPLKYEWTLCDGSKATGVNAEFEFKRPEPCTITLTATNSAGQTCTATKRVNVATEERIVLRGINFDFDKSDIKAEFVPVLNQGVDILRKNQNITIVIEGHTDSVGTDEYNQKLSERRANAVKNFFVQKGVDARRVSTIGYGESRPKFDNATDEGRYMNRRVEIQVK